MSTLVYAVVEIAFMFAISIFFAAIAIDRKTLISTALAAISWLTSAALNFIFDPLGSGNYVCYIFLVVGIVFVFQLIYVIVEHIQTMQNSRFEVEPV